MGIWIFMNFYHTSYFNVYDVADKLFDLKLIHEFDGTTTSPPVLECLEKAELVCIRWRIKILEHIISLRLSDSAFVVYQQFSQEGKFRRRRNKERTTNCLFNRQIKCPRAVYGSSPTLCTVRRCISCRLMKACFVVWGNIGTESDMCFCGGTTKPCETNIASVFENRQAESMLTIG